MRIRADSFRVWTGAIVVGELATADISPSGRLGGRRGGAALPGGGAAKVSGSRRPSPLRFPTDDGLTTLGCGRFFRTQLLRRLRHKPFSQDPLQDYLHVHRVVLEEGR